MGDPELRIRPCPGALSERLREDLARQLTACPDVAFAHLVQVEVDGPEAPGPVLFVWLRPAAVGSLRGALNLVSETVAGVLPERQFVDVVILNSAPELLEQVERAGGLLAEPDPEERRRALAAAAAQGDVVGEPPPTRRWWWPFR